MNEHENEIVVVEKQEVVNKKSGQELFKDWAAGCVQSSEPYLKQYANDLISTCIDKVLELIRNNFAA